MVMKSMTMKSVLAFALFSYVVGSALARPLPPLSVSEFADTEVTACHSLDQAMPSVCGLKFDLAFGGTPSNNVEITFGRDDDGDGSLSFWESDVRVGWDCGAIRRRGFGDGNCCFPPVNEFLMKKKEQSR